MRRAVLAAAALAAGAAHALSFAPFNLPWLQVLALALLFALTTRCGGGKCPATLAFCAFLALYPALALGLSQALVPAAWPRLALMLPATWALSEWLRGTL